MAESKMIIIADSSPLIALASIEKLDILQKIFDKVYISSAVYDEICREEKLYSKKLKTIFKNSVKIVNNKVAVHILCEELDKGEAESIALALEKNIDTILVDDLKARRKALSQGLHVIGTLGVLCKAKEQGLIKKIKPLIDTLMSNNIRISSILYEQVLKQENE